MVFFGGIIEIGLKYLNIDINIGLDYFDFVNGGMVLNIMFLDEFIYEEFIFVGYFSFDKSFEKWNISLGIRVEYIDVKGILVFLGSVNI